MCAVILWKSVWFSWKSYGIFLKICTAILWKSVRDFYELLWDFLENMYGNFMKICDFYESFMGFSWKSVG